MCLLLTGAEAEGSAIPEVVPIEGLASETQEAAGAAPEPAEVASVGAPRWPKRSATRYCQSQTWK
jgi:hypothetical protein